MRYVELHCKSNFSFLEGASHADELFQRASELGYSALAITDRNTLAGIVRAHTAAKEANLRLIIGAELHPIDGPPLIVWPQNKEGYSRLCSLISRGRLRSEKGQCRFTWRELLELASRHWLAGLLLRQPCDDQVTSAGGRQTETEPESTEISGGMPSCRFDPADDDCWLQWLHLFRDRFADRGYLPVELQRGVDDEEKLNRFSRLSQLSKVPLVAAGDVHYHCPERSLLQDCLMAIRYRASIDQVASQRLANSEYHLRPIERISGLFRACPDAIDRSLEIAERIDFSLEELRYQYPTELAPPGKTPVQHLKELTWIGAKKRYPAGVPEKVIALLKHEIELIEQLGYEAYFLTVWDLVRFARSRGILCQGRGSAANSVVCYCLGITSVDPNRLDLLFERFISKERNEAPDIDVDFEHQRREEVLQYIYDKYGRHRAGMTATVITYRVRSAIRDAGRALGISLDRIDALSKTIDDRLSEATFSDYLRDVGLEPDSDLGQRFNYLVQHLVGFPRHLSQHVGGMVITQETLSELCPLENAAMDGRTVIQWDKDDLDELGILKVDCLSLGMLSAIHRCFDLLEKHYDRPMTLATVPAEDPAVYDMICQADTIGVFQIESRAQMSMLPRLQPRCFYDLVIEVAIVRPGPIQGQMVHPYLAARRTGKQPDYPNDAIRQVLEKTMGVPIFQEQAMRLAVVAAGFTPGEADLLRRAMAAWRRPGLIDQFRKKLLDGMLANGLSREFAERVFHQIRGFGEYGFPESHAASFALLVYVSCWLKHHYPAAFCTALLNSQPMGFYAPAQLVQDAQNHGVRVAPVDVNQSQWECTLEQTSDSTCQVRLGLLMVKGLAESVGQRIAEARRIGGAFADLAQFRRRTGLAQASLSRLAQAGALESLTGDRRAALWQSLGQERSSRDHTLLESFGVDEDELVPEALDSMSQADEVVADYETTGLSLRAHPISFIRAILEQQRVTGSRELKTLPHGSQVRVAGIVLIRQRPGTAKGITFVTLEDEFGSTNLVIQPKIWQRHAKVARRSNAWLVHGVVENRENIIHVLVGRIDDLSQQTGAPNIPSRDFH